MWFVVNFRDGLSPRVDEFPHVILIQDNWDDYGYQTTFESGLRLSADETIDLGNVKILKIDQTGGYTEVPREPFQELGPDFCSLGNSLEYYEKLLKCGPNIYRPYLQGLSDITFSDV